MLVEKLILSEEKTWDTLVVPAGEFLAKDFPCTGDGHAPCWHAMMLDIQGADGTVVVHFMDSSDSSGMDTTLVGQSMQETYRERQKSVNVYNKNDGLGERPLSSDATIAFHPEFTNGWVSGTQYLTSNFSELTSIYYRINEVGQVSWQGKIINDVSLNLTDWYDCFENLPPQLIPDDSRLSLQIAYYENAENKMFDCNFGWYPNRSAMSIQTSRVTQPTGNARINLSQVMYQCSISGVPATQARYVVGHPEFTDGPVAISGTINGWGFSGFGTTYEVSSSGRVSLSGTLMVSRAIGANDATVIGASFLPADVAPTNSYRSFTVMATGADFSVPLTVTLSSSGEFSLWHRGPIIETGGAGFLMIALDQISYQLPE